MILQISVKDDKAELFLQLIQELKNSMIDKFHIVSNVEDDDITGVDARNMVRVWARYNFN